MRAAILVIVLFVAGCAAETVQIAGPFAARLSALDIQQIKLVTSKDSHDRVRRIDAVSATKVRVESGSETRYVILTIIKREGQWRIDKSPGVEAVNKRPILAY
jgi:hypothetical protein